MANAGRVAIVPKGDWNVAAEYKRLDAVAYNNTLYIAKKAVPAGTLPTDTAYWMKCVVGGVGAIATTEDAGSVKAGDDIGVDSTGEMTLKTDYAAQTDLAELTGAEKRNIFFGKIAKAVSSLISHISLGATADKAGHVKLSNSSAVTDSTGLALPATEKNASLDGTLAQQIAALNKSLKWSAWTEIDLSALAPNAYIRYRYNAYQIEIDFYAATYTNTSATLIYKLPAGLIPGSYFVSTLTGAGENFFILDNNRDIFVKCTNSYCRGVMTVGRA